MRLSRGFGMRSTRVIQSRIDFLVQFSPDTGRRDRIFEDIRDNGGDGAGWAIIMGEGQRGVETLCVETHP